MAGYIGIVALGSVLDVAIAAKNSSNVPTDADSSPTYRIYGPAGFMNSGTLAFKDTAAVTSATSANPTVYTSAGHNLSVGAKVTIAGVNVVSGSNGFNVSGNVTAVTTNTFTLATDNSGSGVYSSGGIWHVVGLYDFTFTPTVGANYQSGTVYTVFVYGLFSTVNNVIDVSTFQVS